MISKDNSEHYIWGDKCDGWYLVNRQDMLIIHEKMPPKTCEKRHYHSTSRQFFFVLNGVLTMELEGKEHQIGIQQGIEIPLVQNTRPEMTMILRSSLSSSPIQQPGGSHRPDLARIDHKNSLPPPLGPAAL